MSDLHIHRIESNHAVLLTKLWRAAFPSDPINFIEGFFANLPHNAVTLVGENDGGIVTMLFLLPANALFRGISYPVRYLYAGCTHPQYRGHGYYRELMNAAEKTVAAMGESAIYLHPADERLTDTYKRLGYRSGIFGSRARADLPMSVCASVDVYMQKRNEVIDCISQDAVFWNVSDGIAHFFVADAYARGAKMMCTDNDVALSFKETAIETIGIDARRENADHCLWLPVGDSPLLALMQEFDGVTGLVGD